MLLLAKCPSVSPSDGECLSLPGDQYPCSISDRGARPDHKMFVDKAHSNAPFGQPSSIGFHRILAVDGLVNSS